MGKDIIVRIKEYKDCLIYTAYIKMEQICSRTFIEEDGIFYRRLGIRHSYNDNENAYKAIINEHPEAKNGIRVKGSIIITKHPILKKSEEKNKPHMVISKKTTYKSINTKYGRRY